MKTQTAEIEYVFNLPNGTSKIVKGRTPAEALGIFLRRGRYGLGAAWRLTRQPDGYIFAVNSSGRTLERQTWKFREVNYVRGMR